MISVVDSIKIPAHPNIYTGTNKRELRIDFSLPECPNENTGLFILIPGFGAHIDSKIYQKLLRELPNKYNVVAIQCDYFGSEFMQDANSLTLVEPEKYLTRDELSYYRQNPQQIVQMLIGKPIRIRAKANLGESSEHFADLSFMQAIDIITSIEAIKIILRENNIPFNANRTISYGQSQGAYISLLANRLAPQLFSFIIDNSAWEYPKYLDQNRLLMSCVGLCEIVEEFEYYVRTVLNTRSLELDTIYDRFENKAFIYSILGSEDILVSIEKKKRFLKNVNFTHLEFIQKKDVDGIIYKSAEHGLGANFIELIDHVMKRENGRLNEMEYSPMYRVQCGDYIIEVNYQNALPIFNLIV